MVSEPTMAQSMLPKLNISQCVTLKLTDRNYMLWRSQFQSYLASHLLFGYVDGTTIPPPLTITISNSTGVNSESPNPAHQTWLQTDQLVRSWILGSLSEDVLSLVIGCASSYEVWTTLSSHFNRTSSARLFELQRRLQTISKQNRSISEYLREFKSLCDQLHSIGHPVPDTMKIFGVLQGLGREFEAFVTVIESSMDSNPPSYDDVLSRLQSFDDRLQQYNATPEVNPHLAFNTSRSHSAPSSPYRGRNFESRARGGFHGRQLFSTRDRGFHQQISPRPATASGAEVLTKNRFKELELKELELQNRMLAIEVAEAEVRDLEMKADWFKTEIKDKEVELSAVMEKLDRIQTRNREVEEELDRKVNYLAAVLDELAECTKQQFLVKMKLHSKSLDYDLMEHAVKSYNNELAETCRQIESKSKELEDMENLIKERNAQYESIKGLIEELDSTKTYLQGAMDNTVQYANLQSSSSSGSLTHKKFGLVYVKRKKQSRNH